MAKKTLQDYLLGIKREFEYTVRIAVSELPSEQMKRIENNLKEHGLVDITKPKKTIFQVHPLGFTEPTNSEVVIFNVTLSLPASCFYLGRSIAKIIGISEMYVVVNGIDNPLQDIKDGNKVDNVKHEDLYGDKYNENMLKTILKARKKDPESIMQTAKDEE